MRIRMPEGWEPKVQGEVPATRDAATVALLRDTPDGTETYLLRRQPTMAFAAGMSVFPGGSTQDGDELPLRWVGPAPEEWAERLRCSVEVARGLVVAAVRETFEESGILLAGPDEHTTATELDTDEITQVRLDLDTGRRALADVLDEYGWVLRTDLLGAWAHWITPAFEPRRYDTRFLVGAVPAGQRVGSLPGEADRATWIPVADVLDAVRTGDAAMLPPTWVTCRELAEVGVPDLLDVAGRRSITPIEPRLVEVDGELFLENPIDEGAP